MKVTIVLEKLFKDPPSPTVRRELNAFAGATYDTPAPRGIEPSLLTHPVIGRGIAIAPIPRENRSGGSSVYIIAIAAVTLEIIRDWLECASSFAGRSSLCERPIPPKPDHA